MARRNSKNMYSKSQNNNALFYNVETSFYGISAIYKNASQLKTFHNNHF